MTQDELKQHLHYNPETGVFTWLDNIAKPLRWRNRYPGTEAGTTSKNGYRLIYLKNKQWYAHRLAFLYEHGYMPKEIDHIDGVRMNNKILNLRDVSHSDNGKNTKRPKDNTSGVIGVDWDKSRKRWRVQISHLGKNIFGGRYLSFDDAVAARNALNKKYNFHENHGR